MILVDNVHYAYDGIYTALQGVSLQIDPGERIAIMGENGAGKTTLLKHLNGLLRPQKGHVYLDGKDTSRSSVAELSKKVGLVWQNPDLQLFLNSVEEEVMFGLRNLGLDEEESTARCEETLEYLLLTPLRNRSPFSLSGGERKRVALASVLAVEPQILALDEPTIGQDARQKEKLAELIIRLNNKGKTVIVVTHDTEFVIEHCPRTIAMAGGRIIADGPTSSVLSNSKVLDYCSLSPPEMTRAARALSSIFDQVPDRLTQVPEIEGALLRLLGGA
ncbi:MAG: energy-coupling factor ABC transporter ATP-binding protein [Candidatus Thorarchaeota archaeon]